jgi:hypothetical protein
VTRSAHNTGARDVEMTSVQPVAEIDARMRETDVNAPPQVFICVRDDLSRSVRTRFYGADVTDRLLVGKCDLALMTMASLPRGSATD